MAEIGIEELKAKATTVIDRVERGATYVITRHGNPAAVLLPIGEAEDLVLASADEFLRVRWKAWAAYSENRTIRLEDLA